MSPLVILASLAVASSVPLLAFSLLSGRASNRRVTTNLASGLSVPGNLRKLTLAQPARERTVGPILTALGRNGRRLTPTGVVQAVERRLHLAGDPWPVETFFAAKLVVTVVAAGMAVMWVFADPSTTTILLVPAAVALGMFGPDTVVARRARERQDEILRTLPDTLDQLTVCVEAGLGFDAALARVAKTRDGPLGKEIQRALQDIQLGIPRRDALQRVLDRSDVPELRQFVHAVSQAETYGVPIASVLRTQAAEQRHKRAARAEESAQKMPVKLVFPLVLCILPSLFVVVLGPAALRILRSGA